MNIYIWEDLPDLTHNYHGDGGAAVIADGWEAAVALLQSASAYPQDEERLALSWSGFPLAEPTPLPKVIIFPNAGCC